MSRLLCVAVPAPFGMWTPSPVASPPNGFASKLWCPQRRVKSRQRSCRRSNTSALRLPGGVHSSLRIALLHDQLDRPPPNADPRTQIKGEYCQQCPLRPVYVHLIPFPIPIMPYAPSSYGQEKQDVRRTACTTLDPYTGVAAQVRLQAAVSVAPPSPPAVAVGVGVTVDVGAVVGVGLLRLREATRVEPWGQELSF